MFRQRRQTVASVLLMSSLVALAPLMVSAQQAQQRVTLSGHAAYSRVSPPSSGVKLLEDIFMRVRSAPQIAMAKNLYKQQLDMPQQVQQGPTDYRYAIRPKRLAGKTAPSSATLQMVPAETSSESLAAAFGGINTNSSSLIASRNEPVEYWKGNRQFPMVASNSVPSSGVWESPAAQSVDKLEQSPAKLQSLQPLNAKESKQSRNINLGKDMKSEDDSTAYHPPDLATAIGRLSGLTQQIQSAQNWAEQNTNSVQAERQRRAITSNRGKAIETAYANEGVCADEESGALKAKKKPVATPTPAAPPASAPVGGMLRDQRADGDSFSVGQKGPKIAMGDIALLPPNVVTGIPLVRLGISERQASGALQAIGSMSQQKVNSWTVWSWNRPQNKNATSLQLYMRNGLLDAMRIFDPTLIGPDFGVSLGDSLAKVKEKFGEPAMMLPEPGPGAGQNYIYPISQIGFQLARPAPGQPPRVVSVLIFNVK